MVPNIYVQKTASGNTEYSAVVQDMVDYTTRNWQWKKRKKGYHIQMASMLWDCPWEHRGLIAMGKDTWNLEQIWNWRRWMKECEVKNEIKNDGTWNHIWKFFFLRLWSQESETIGTLWDLTVRNSLFELIYIMACLKSLSSNVKSR